MSVLVVRWHPDPCRRSLRSAPSDILTGGDRGNIESQCYPYPEAQT